MKKDGARMAAEVLREIEKIGLENVARALKVTPNKVTHKIEHPKSLTLRDLAALQAVGFTDRAVLLILDKLKREG